MITIHSSQLRLRPLAIPIGFQVLFNEFYDILDAGRGIIFEDPDDFPTISPYELYKSTILQLLYEPYNLLIDLGWCPEANPDGKFDIVVIRTDDRYWDHPLVEFSSRYGNVIAEKLNEIMRDISEGRIK